MGCLDLEYGLSLAAVCYVSVHQASEDLVVVEVVVSALLLLHRFLDDDVGSLGKSQIGAQGLRVLPYITPDDRLEYVPGVDVFVRFVPRIYPGEFQGDFERSG